MYKSMMYLLVILLLSGCSFFQIRKPVIEQGNMMTTEAVNKLSIGMSPSQVVDIMGNPVLTNIFTPNRMEYVYTYDNHTGNKIVNKLTCLFEHGKLKSIQKN
ncbi:MAG: outer membrane protein assembly factor BamE [Gammaproteobacteria bacterium]|nr:outer membrane protein assembly factor BamE [Gammaproteobacteria bacterium]MCW5583577.1 outer membrane protein assembly factor BamE [Gammaproteobacteria bacterium]